MSRTLKYDEFERQVYAIRRCLKLKPSTLFEKVCFEKTASVLSHEIEDSFSDKENNFRLWLYGKSCYFNHPQTKKTIAIKIGNSLPAIYHFLMFCKELKEGKHEDIGYIAFLITQSNNTERSNECPIM